MSDEASPAEVQGFLSAFADLPQPGQYTAMDRYQDFRRVFLGSEEGKRVLRELLAWGHCFRPSVPAAAGPIDPYAVVRNEGERNIALRLLKVVNTEPVDRPARGNSTPE